MIEKKTSLLDKIGRYTLIAGALVTFYSFGSMTFDVYKETKINKKPEMVEINKLNGSIGSLEKEIQKGLSLGKSLDQAMDFYNSAYVSDTTISQKMMDLRDDGINPERNPKIYKVKETIEKQRDILEENNPYRGELKDLSDDYKKSKRNMIYGLYLAMAGLVGMVISGVREKLRENSST